VQVEREGQVAGFACTMAVPLHATTTACRHTTHLPAQPRMQSHQQHHSTAGDTIKNV
jgi:hypothetical protein